MRNGNLRPNLTGQPFYTNIPGGGTAYQYLNQGAFSRPPDFTPTVAGGAPLFGVGDIGSAAYASYYANPLRFFGNAAPTYSSLRGQPFFTEDFNVLKKTRITETTTFEIRVDFINAFNRGRFILPGVDLNVPFNPVGPSGFGVSTRAGDFYQPRHIQLGARLIF